MWSIKSASVLLVVVIVGQCDAVKSLGVDALLTNSPEAIVAGGPDTESVVMIKCVEESGRGEMAMAGRDIEGRRDIGAEDSYDRQGSRPVDLVLEPRSRGDRSLATITVIDDNSTHFSADASKPILPSSPSPAPRSTGTNFIEGVPYNFSYVFFIGGDCDGLKPDWYYDFIQAGLKTLKVAQVICPDNPKNLEWWEREYHLIALDEVVRVAGDKLNETLVITVGVGLETDWTPVVDLLHKGMAFFHAKEDPIENLNFNLTEHGLSPHDILYLYFQWDEKKAAQRNGVEMCRLMQGNKQLKVAKILFGNRDSAPLDYRVNIALDVFKTECPKVEVIELWTVYHNITPDAFKATLLFNPLPDVVMTCRDEHARDFLKIAEEILLPEEMSQIVTTGWNNIEKDLLNEHKILFTVDQLVHYAHEGIWRAIGTVVDIVQKTGLNSTAAIQKSMDRGNSVTVTADTLPVSGDRAGFLISALLAGYDPGFPPYEDVRVSTGLRSVSITQMTPFEGKFEVVLWLKMSWRDPRMKWNPIVYDGELPIDPEKIWTPSLYFLNAFERKDLYLSPAMVTYDGLVETETNMLATFLCATTEDLRSFPFDAYNCSIELGSPQGVTMNQIYGFEVVDSDPHYETTYGTFLEHADHHEDERPEDHRSTTVYYKLHFVRRPFTTYMRLIIPAILINMIGFMAFWIPELPESVALGITSLLCSLAFRETVEMPDTADITWTEIFMMVNISYLASVLFITWCSYSNSTHLGKKLNQLCMPCHPKTVARETKQLAKSVRGMTHSNGSTSDVAVTERLKLEMEYDRECKAARKKLEELYSGGDGAKNRSYRDSRRDFNIHDMEAELKFQSSKHDFNQHDFEAEMKYNMRNNIRTKATNKDDMNGSFHENSYDLAMDDEASEGPNWDSYRSLQGLYSNASRHAPLNDMDDDIEMAPYSKPEPRRKSQPPRPNLATAALGESKVKKEKPDFATERKNANVDWIGRWFVVPSYIIVMATLLLGGWGFK